MSLSPRTRQRMRLFGFLVSLVILASTAALVAESARLVEVVGLVGSSFAAGITGAGLFARNRSRSGAEDA